jgi:hypothetical protein
MLNPPFCYRFVSSLESAAPLRRAILNSNLELWQYNSGCCAGYASGGFMADVVVGGTVSSGRYICRVFLLHLLTHPLELVYHCL